MYTDSLYMYVMMYMYLTLDTCWELVLINPEFICKNQATKNIHQFKVINFLPISSVKVVIFLLVFIPFASVTTRILFRWVTGFKKDLFQCKTSPCLTRN